MKLKGIFFLIILLTAFAMLGFFIGLKINNKELNAGKPINDKYHTLPDIKNYRNVQHIETPKVNKGDIELYFPPYNSAKFRIQDVECPESKINEKAKQQMKKWNMSEREILVNAQKASGLLAEIIYSNPDDVYIFFNGVDKDGYAVGDMFVDGVNVRSELLKSGLCMPVSIQQHQD